jgi:hypothetical protein
MKKIVFYFLFLSCYTSWAQSEMTLPFYNSIAQSSLANVSNTSGNRVVIGLPMISSGFVNFYTTGFSYRSLISKSDNTTAQLSVNSFINKLKQKNHVGLDLSTDLFSIQLALAKFNVGFSISEKINFRVTYPGDLLKLVWFGNASYFDQALSIGGFGFNLNHYREYAINANKTFGKLTIGARGKLLFGKFNIYTKTAQIDLTTSSDFYALNIATALDVRTSGFPNELPGAGFEPLQFTKSYLFSGQNKGTAWDLAAAYKFNDKFDLSAGINNIGYIHWSNNVNNLVSESNEFSFNGVKLNGIASGDSFTTKFVLDSLKNLLALQVNHNEYNSILTNNVFVMAQFQFAPKHYAGAMLNTEFAVRQIQPYMVINYKFAPSRHFNIGLNYSFRRYSPFSLGGAIMVQGIGFQGYFVADNLIAMINPLSSKFFNFRTGLNIAIGPKKK